MKREVGDSAKRLGKFYRNGHSEKLKTICYETDWDYDKAVKLTKNIDKGLSIGKLHEILIELGIEEDN